MFSGEECSIRFSTSRSVCPIPGTGWFSPGVLHPPHHYGWHWARWWRRWEVTLLLMRALNFSTARDAASSPFHALQSASAICSRLSERKTGGCKFNSLSPGELRVTHQGPGGQVDQVRVRVLAQPLNYVTLSKLLKISEPRFLLRLWNKPQTILRG